MNPWLDFGTKVPYSISARFRDHSRLKSDGTKKKLVSVRKPDKDDFIFWVFRTKNFALGPYICNRQLNQPEIHGFPKIIGKQGSANGELNRPWGVCAIPDGGFCVADRSNNRIQFFAGDGDHWLTFPPPTGDNEQPTNSDEIGKFNRPAGVAFTFFPLAAIVVADKDNHRIQVRPSFSTLYTRGWVIASAYGCKVAHLIYDKYGLISVQLPQFALL